MANRAKEDSERDPLEDELEFCRAMRHAGFGVQHPWQMLLSVPGEESSHCSQWDFYAKGRLFCFGQEKDKDFKNKFLQGSELARTGKVPEATVNTEIVSITQGPDETEKYDQMRVCPATRSAQKGPDVWKNLYKHLFTTSKALSQHARPLVCPGDEVIVVDVHVHSGDHALGCLMMQDQMPAGVVSRHVMVKLKEKKIWSSVEWSSKRIGNWLCDKWLRHEVKLLGKTGKPVPPLETEVTASWKG